MELKIESQKQLELIITHTLNQYNDCVIEFKVEDFDKPIVMVSTEIPNGYILLSMMIGNHSLGDAIPIHDKEMKHKWINECLKHTKEIVITSIMVTIKQNKDDIIRSKSFDDFVDELEDEFQTCKLDPEGYNEIIDYREDYLTKHNRMKITQTPVKLSSQGKMQAKFQFNNFLNKDNMNKIIISFTTIVPDCNHEFILDLIIDKIYVYGRTFISFVLSRPDFLDEEMELKSMEDNMMEYNSKYKKSHDEIHEIFDNMFNYAYRQAELVSGEKVNIYFYSNCKVIK